MPAWDPFVAVALVTLVLLLVLARLSQDAIDEYAPGSTRSESAETAQPESPAEQQPSIPDDISGITPRNSSAEIPAETSAHTSPTPPGNPGEESLLTEDAMDEPGEEYQPPGEMEPELELTPKVLLANVALTQGLVLTVLIGAAWYFDIPAAAFGVTADALSTGLPAVAIGLAFGVVLWVANELSTTLADAVGASYDERVREMLAPETPLGWVALFGGVLPFIALAEEIMFRAALIGVPEAAYGINVWLLALGSSLAFALGHGAQGRVGVVVTGALGLVLAAGYIYTGSLLMVVIAHYVINVLEFLVHELFGLDGLTGLARVAG